MSINPSYYQIGRRYLFVALFAGLITLAGFSLFNQQASAAGTIPPGGTLPPGGSVPFNKGQVNIIHLAPFDANIANTAVDVCTETNTPVAGATNLHYLEQSGFLTLSSGSYDWKVTQPGCGATILDLAPFVLGNQGVITLLIIGDRVNQPLSSLLLVQDTGLINVYLPLITKK
ncbi:hypothetical protein BH10CHL1_BH10CHL1_12470 [soil metagenome]